MHILRELWTNDIDENEVKSSYQYVLDLRERLVDTLKLAQEQLKLSLAKQKCYYDKRTKVRRFQPGDKVLGSPADRHEQAAVAVKGTMRCHQGSWSQWSQGPDEGKEEDVTCKSAYEVRRQRGFSNRQCCASSSRRSPAEYTLWRCDG